MQKKEREQQELNLFILSSRSKDSLIIVRTFTSSKYQLLNGSLIYQRKAYQELVAGSEAKFKWEIRQASKRESV